MNKKIKEELVFSALMTVGMAAIMLIFNMILMFGFTKEACMGILTQFVPIYIAAFAIEQLVVSHNVNKLHKIIVSPSDSKFKYITIMAILMATCMSLLMTLYTSLIYVGTENNFWHHFIFAWLHNYPVALFSQLVVVGPIVRLIHKNIFKKSVLVD